MKKWNAQRVASAAGASLIAAPGSLGGPERAIVDSRKARSGDLFVGLPGARADGGEFAAAAVAAGAWGVLVGPAYADVADAGHPGVVLAAANPLAALQALATNWRRELGAQTIAVTGSTGKTSTKDLIAALLTPHRRTVASRANFNTEIGLPLEILAAPAETEVLVLEMGMRGVGQIAELTAIAEPDVALIVSIGPVHLELLGSIEAIAAAKAELIAGLSRDGTAIVPAGEPRLAPHLRPELHTVTFGEGGDVRMLAAEDERVIIDAEGERIALELSFTQAHLRSNLLGAVAAARAVGVMPSGRVDLVLSAGRGDRMRLPGGITVIDDCYNANPVSMRAALSDLADTAARAGGRRRVAVLGDMLELGERERDYHAELAGAAGAASVDVLVTVGPLAAAIGEGFGGEAHAVSDATQAATIVPELVREGDVVLVKASRGVGLELVCAALGSKATA